jgi:hypothetical protein
MKLIHEFLSENTEKENGIIFKSKGEIFVENEVRCYASISFRVAIEEPWENT